MRRFALVVFALIAVSCTRVEGPAGALRELPTLTTSNGIEMVLIPDGEFVMGSEQGNDDEAPAHRVRIGPLLMDRYEVTQKQYEKLMEENPSKVKGPEHPVEMISWVLAALYCNARSRAEGLEPCYDEETALCDLTKSGYRLPTEAEWEYACRAGTRGDYSFAGGERELRDHAWFAGNSSKTTYPVGLKKPNPWGLFDMHGNIAEWTNDIYDRDYYRRSPPENPRGPDEGKQYTVRGGSWKAGPGVLRSAYRVAENPGFADACLAPDTLGLRCVRNAPGESETESDATKEEAKATEAPPAETERNQTFETSILHGETCLQYTAPERFPELTRIVEGISGKCCERRLVPLLEGGRAGKPGQCLDRPCSRTT